LQTRSTCSRVMSTLSSMRPYLFNRRTAFRLVSAGVLTVAGAGLDLLVPYAFSAVTSGLSVSILGLELSSNALIGASAGAYIIRDIVVSYRNEVLAPVAPKSVVDLDTAYSRHALTRSLEQRATAKPEEDIVRLQKGFYAMYSITDQLFSNIVPVTVNTIFASALFGWQSPISGAGLAGVVIGSALYNVSTTKKNVKLRHESLVKSNHSYDDLMRTLQHTGTIQKNGNEEYEQKRCVTSHKEWAQAEIKSNAYAIQVSRRQTLLMDAIFAGLCFTNSSLSPQQYSALLTYLFLNLGSVSSFSSAVTQVVSGVADLEPLFQHMAIRPGVEDGFPNNKLNIETKNANVEFKDVSLTLGGKLILNKINCVIPAGKKTVIVGESGSGKSTLLSLIDRTYDPTSGIVLINGKDIKQHSLQSVRSHVATIQQKTDLFHESIGKNIRYGRLNATNDELKQAAGQARIDTFIESLPEKYEANVGERGSLLSGGQAQRVGIARALIRQPKILLCDEATSALDPATKVSIQEEIDWIPDVTKVHVVHDLSVAIDADLIIVLDKGRIVEIGTHAELLKKNDGHYKTMWDTQAATVATSEENKVIDEKAIPAPGTSSAAPKPIEPVKNKIEVIVEQPKDEKNALGGKSPVKSAAAASPNKNKLFVPVEVIVPPVRSAFATGTSSPIRTPPQPESHYIDEEEQAEPEKQENQPRESWCPKLGGGSCTIL